MVNGSGCCTSGKQNSSTKLKSVEPLSTSGGNRYETNGVVSRSFNTSTCSKIVLSAPLLVSATDIILRIFIPKLFNQKNQIQSFLNNEFFDCVQESSSARVSEEISRAKRSIRWQDIEQISTYKRHFWFVLFRFVSLKDISTFFLTFFDFFFSFFDFVSNKQTNLEYRFISKLCWFSIR